MFLPKLSWVKEGSKTEDLLKHEELHLQMAEYVAAKASDRGKLLVGKGQGTGSTQQHAKVKAEDAARKDVFAKLNALYAQWQQVDATLPNKYDTEVKDPNLTPIQSAINQDDWSANWQSKADDVLKQFKWDEAPK